MITATVSGTTSNLTGGMFANGAVTGAFVHMFNAMGKYYHQSKHPFRSIVINGIKRGVNGGIIGAGIGGVLDEGIGSLAGAAFGTTVGFASGLVEGVIKESTNNNYVIGNYIIEPITQSIKESFDNGDYTPNNTGYTIDGNHWIMP